MKRTAEKPKKTVSEILHLAVLIPCGVLFPVTIVWLLCAAGVTLTLFPAVLILNLLPLICKRAHRTVVRVLRLIAIAATLLYLMLPVVRFSFESDKAMYPLKKFVYGSEYCKLLLPDSLPAVCEDYRIITQSAMGGLQDYHASLYLTFHTDAETLYAYEAYLDTLDIAQRYENQPLTEDELADMAGFDEEWILEANCPDEFPKHVYGKIHPPENLEHAVTYVINEYYNKGCLLNYDTGLVVFWL